MDVVSSYVKEMQKAFRADLNEAQVQLYNELGKGAYGTVYHGVLGLLLGSITVCP